MMGQVRCDYCGWSNNPEGATNCEKCNQELIYSVPTSLEDLKQAQTSPLQTNCTKCGYPVSSESSFCPNCGTAVSSSVNPLMKQTIRDVPSESLQNVNLIKKTIEDFPVSLKSSDEAENLNLVTFKLKPIDINTPEVFNFESDTNASFEFADGQWFISDCGTGTTFVSAARRIALQKGDVVLMGGKKFLFD